MDVFAASVCQSRWTALIVRAHRLDVCMPEAHKTGSKSVLAALAATIQYEALLHASCCAFDSRFRVRGYV